MPPAHAYAELVHRHGRLYRIRHAMAMLAWDRATLMPPGGVGARAAAEAELQLLARELRADPLVGEWLDAAAGEPLGDWEAANLREMRRDWLDARAVPARVVERRVIATASCELGWRRQRPANDWRAYLPAFREVVAICREEAGHLGDALGCSRYDALLQRFEPGINAARVAATFDELVSWLPALIATARSRGDTLPPLGTVAVDVQRQLARTLAARLGFDFDHGRLDESAHPFTGGVAEDVRITTRFSEEALLQGINSTIHETGHARYVAGLPPAWREQPVGAARSFGVHESQSLGLEMQLARTPAFCELLSSLLIDAVGERPAFAADALYARMTRVQPGAIRVHADEPSYPLHVIARFRIERALIEGDIAAADVPAMWDEQMARLLDLDTRGNHRDGCLQDIHWSKGAFGYFPSYTLGAIYAAQLFAALKSELGELDGCIRSGGFESIFAWLGARVWAQGSRFETDELLRRATGSALDAAPYRAHLLARYGHQA
ncbi:MAG: carboxypeptidase M32 [Rhodocyclaceae bacterium]|nr:carboxypeptidase M32 [Rhodocyclaceae bacterium]